MLSANYVAARLREAYPVLYAGPGGLVAHECILDLRALTASSGITVEDVAKRLIDYGFHAPTMSFPVAGTLMVEPTESESLAELDRFCDAMLGIREEIAAVERGEVAAADSVLRGAPHDAHTVTADEWDRAYPRSLAAWPGHAVAGRARGSTSTGRRSAASTTPTATATWSAPARRSRPTRTPPRLTALPRPGAPAQTGFCALTALVTLMTQFCALSSSRGLTDKYPFGFSMTAGERSIP